MPFSVSQPAPTRSFGGCFDQASYTPCRIYKQALQTQFSLFFKHPLSLICLCQPFSILLVASVDWAHEHMGGFALHRPRNPKEPYQSSSQMKLLLFPVAPHLSISPAAQRVAAVVVAWRGGRAPPGPPKKAKSAPHHSRGRPSRVAQGQLGGHTRVLGVGSASGRWCVPR